MHVQESNKTFMKKDDIDLEELKDELRHNGA
jgi:hypothetical protein